MASAFPRRLRLAIIGAYFHARVEWEEPCSSVNGHQPLPWILNHVKSVCRGRFTRGGGGEPMMANRSKESLD